MVLVEYSTKDEKVYSLNMSKGRGGGGPFYVQARLLLSASCQSLGPGQDLD